ncbi:MAG: hypothetical protein CVU38_20225 [Chloroflexi bacterium HGW-Chloroflexi-1]|nr:MAG: hypothetical protein CVU38_20225 [Chloroflexi bacterium HGW-Chloroflexi-1]
MTVRILSVSEAKRQIKSVVEQVGQGDQVYYITRYSRPRAVMLSVDHYEALLQRMRQLESELAQSGGRKYS